MKREIVLAGGCFWGTQAFFQKINGIVETQCGYANSNIPNPTYEQVCSSQTNAAEAVKLVYEDDLISLERVITAFFKTINPTSINRQGGDIGSQYRSGIYYIEESDSLHIHIMIEKLQKDYTVSIATEVLKLNNFYPAEDYHQDYLKKNPNGYCHVDLRIAKEF